MNNNGNEKSLEVFIPTIKKYYEKYKEIILYIFFGGCTTVISIASFIVFERLLNINELLANILSWILAVSFAYITNRIWVFKTSKSNNKIIKEIIYFFSSRLLTLMLEELILIIFVTWLLFDAIVIKILGQVLILVLNYLISKFVTFRNN